MTAKVILMPKNGQFVAYFRLKNLVRECIIPHAVIDGNLVQDWINRKIRYLQSTGSKTRFTVPS